MNRFSKTGPAMQLMAISFLSLFLEMAMIRFINSTVQVIGYFNNLLIISAFLGLGLGSMLVSTKRDYFGFFPYIFILVIGIMVLLDKVGVVSTLTDSVFWVDNTQATNLPVIPIILVVFFSNLLFFIPLGNKLGFFLGQFENKLIGYAFDLLGSLIGVASFGLVSYWQLPPMVWFSMAGGIVLVLGSKSLTRAVVAALLLAGAVFLSSVPRAGFWSPYYKIGLVPYRFYHSSTGKTSFLGYGVTVDKLRIQDALNFSGDLDKTNLKTWIDYYRLPYQLIKPKKVLILGGGAGNDAAIALTFSPERIDVVEIDPVLISLGHTLHPHRPYNDPVVRTITDDARAFLKRNNDLYDLIIMNALDSHHQLPGLSTLRLESFIYTVEAFQDVRRHLRQDGVFIVHLSSTRKWMGQRLYWTLTKAFGSEPRLYSTVGSPYGSLAFAYGPENMSPSSPTVFPVDPTEYKRGKDQTLLSTDDWPHLYLAKNRVPELYILVFGFIIVFLATVGKFIPGLTQSKGNLHYALLGAGFMLLETRSITKTALLFGSTWIVSAVVVSSILLILFCSNGLLIGGNKFGKLPCYAGLILALVIGYILPVNFLLATSFWVRVVMVGVWSGLPIFFAGIIFSSSYAAAGDVSSAFGANLLGVVIGGILEYSSMIFGLNSLYLLAIFIYGLAWLSDPAFPMGRRG